MTAILLGGAGCFLMYFFAAPFLEVSLSIDVFAAFLTAAFVIL
jgi:hypothetical protein